MRISDWSSDVCSSDLLPRWCRPTRTSAMAIDNVTFGIQEQALQVQRRRLELIAANIANADTPGFHARDIDLRKVLESAQKSVIYTGEQTQTLSREWQSVIWGHNESEREVFGGRCCLK